jgi:hypothetical protein
VIKLNDFILRKKFRNSQSSETIRLVAAEKLTQLKLKRFWKVWKKKFRFVLFKSSFWQNVSYRAWRKYFHILKNLKFRCLSRRCQNVFPWLSKSVVKDITDVCSCICCILKGCHHKNLFVASLRVLWEQHIYKNKFNSVF